LLHKTHFRCIYTLVLVFLLGGVLQAQNPVQTENSLAGTSGWQLSNPAINREIEGYASLTSVNTGGTIAFSVSTTDSTFDIDIFRTGWYAGVGARLVKSITSLPGGRQTTPTQDPVTRLIECKWPVSYTLSVPTNWVSGVYLARLTGTQSGKQSWIIFVVRDDSRSSAILFVNSVTTYEAYNFWPNGANGRSLYAWGNTSDDLAAWKVSFDRPYVLGRSYSSTSTGAAAGVGAGEYLTNVQPGPEQNYNIFNAGYEYNMVRWLEKNGYDVSYLTDIDVHENATLLKNHRALLSVGHNEYWSMPMLQNVQSALANGLNLGFFSANSPYWQVRFEPASDGVADRTMVSYKYDAPANDPLYNSSPQLSTVRWRDAHVNLPEAAWIGGEYVGDPFEGDMVVSNASHWLMNGTGLHNGDHLTGLLGYEVDAIVPGTSPANIEALTSSPVGPFGNDYDNPPGLLCNTQVCNSNVTWYSAGHGFVFNAGSMNWSWGLDDYNSPSMRPAFSSGAVQALTANILAAFVNPVTVVTASLPSGARGNSYTPFQLTATGGGQPYTWVASGLPSGMALSPSGVLSGTPVSSGSSNIAFTATDAAGHTGSGTLTLVINSGSFTISGQITASGIGLSGVSVSLSGASTSTVTTDSSGNYSFTGLIAGTYVVTPSRSRYTFTPSSQTLTSISSSQTVNFTAAGAPVRTVSIKFVGSGAAMGVSESAGVVAKTNWNNAAGNASSAPLALNDETGVSSGATVTWTSDNSWALPTTDAAGNARMMRGYLDTGNQNPSTISIAGLPASLTGYDVYVYTDGDNETSKNTGAYTISGAGINSASVKSTDAPNVNFSGAFTQAVNSSGDYVKFSSIQATAFTVTATPISASDGGLRAPVNSIQIVPSPAPVTARAVSIKFVGTGTAMGVSESAGVVAKTNWNNATNNVSSAPVGLNDETGVSNGGVVTWASDNNWALPITDAAGNVRMMRGYLDTGNQNPSTISVAGLPTSPTGYDIYVYTDGDNETSANTGAYAISGSGITGTSVQATDKANVNFSGAFTQATNSNGNYVKFSAIQATAFTITATPTTAADGLLRAPVNSIQIVPSAATVTYTISGNIAVSGTGLSGVTVSLGGASTAMTTTDSSGDYSFASLTAGTYTVTPSRNGYTFSPSSKTLTNISSNQTASFIATPPATYTISGQITLSGTALSSVTVALSGALTATTTTDSSGKYSFTSLAPGTYTVTPTRSGYTFTPPSQTFTSISSNQTASFTAAAVTYTISGHVTLAGVSLSGVTVTLSGGVPATTSTDSSGDYSFASLAPGTYTVTPSRTGYAFTPPSQTLTNITSNQTVNFTAAATATYTISGQISASGTALSGVTVALSGGSTATTTTDSAGNYSFAALVPSTYTVTPSRSGYTFTPPSQTFTSITSNQTASFTATAARYTISGQISASGTALSGVTIALSGASTATTTTDSAGVYSFASLASGTYTVTPSRSGYAFTPPSQTFTSISSNQTASFTATTVTYTISGQISASGTGLSGVTVALSGTSTATTTTSSTGAYSFAGLAPGTYTVTPARSGYTFTPPSQTFTGISSNQIASFSAAPITYTISGQITVAGAGLSGVTVALSGTSAVTTTTSSTGAYSFASLAPGTYTVTPSRTGYTFSPTSQTFTNISSNQSASFTAIPPTTYTIGGQITLSGTGLSGVTVALSGTSTATTTTSSAGAYSFAGLVAGTYTITPSRSGYTFTPPSQTFTSISSSQTANFTATTTATTPARVVGIKFVGTGAAMGVSESAGVVAKTHWNNAANNASSAPLALNDETGVSNGATVTWTSDNNWALPITNTAGNLRMMRGYLDTGNQHPSTISVAGLPSSSTGYDIYVYTDGDNGSSTNTGTYTISGAGINSTSIKAIDKSRANFSGSFTQAINSNGNYVKFSSIQATGFTITATPTTASDGNLRAPVNSIQIVPSPAPRAAQAVGINFVGSGAAMGATESAGVVAKSNWNNATNNASTAALALKDEAGVSNGAVVTWASDNDWVLPITNTAGNLRMMRGYLDTGSENPSTISIAGLPTSSTGYDVYVYTDGDNAASTVTGTYTISGAGITNTSVKATDPANIDCNGTFTQATNSNGNYVKFASIQATAFTITATPTTASDNALRAPVNAVQIVPH
jgi:hypothetical protein